MECHYVAVLQSICVSNTVLEEFMPIYANGELDTGVLFENLGDQ